MAYYRCVMSTLPSNTKRSSIAYSSNVLSVRLIAIFFGFIVSRISLNGLSLDQQQRVINTLKIKDKTEVIYNPTGLLIALSKAEREGRLILPIEKKQSPTNTLPRHPSHRNFDSQNHPSNRVTKGLEDHVGKLDWIKSQAGAQGQSMPELARLSCRTRTTIDPSVSRSFRIWG